MRRFCNLDTQQELRGKKVDNAKGFNKVEKQTTIKQDEKTK